MEKLSRTARIINIVLRVLFWAVIVSFAGTAARTYILYTGGDIAASGFPINVGGVTVSSGALSAGGLTRAWIIGTVLYALSAAAVCIAIRILCGIVKPMSQGRPFDCSVSDRLKTLGVFTLICGGVNMLYEIFGKTAVMRLLLPDSGTVSVDHNINLWIFLIASLIFLFSYIFRYGEELQKLSDETL